MDQKASWTNRLSPLSSCRGNGSSSVRRFMADAEIEDGTVICTKCKTTERIADMNPGCKISEDGTITTWVSPKRFSHFRR